MLVPWTISIGSGSLVKGFDDDKIKGLNLIGIRRCRNAQHLQQASCWTHTHPKAHRGNIPTTIKPVKDLKALYKYEINGPIYLCINEFLQ